MDQLSTNFCWTAIVFLVHDTRTESRSKRVYAHSYSTRGAGSKILKASGGKVLNSMTMFLNSCMYAIYVHSQLCTKNDISLVSLLLLWSVMLYHIDVIHSSSTHCYQ